MAISVIRDLLLSHLDSFVPPVGLIDVVKPDEPYKPKTGRPYLEATFAPNETLTPFVGDYDPKRLQGFLQITVVYPRLPSAGFDPWAVANAIIVHYTKGTTLRGEGGVNVKMLREPWASPAYSDEGWTRIPVSIPYVCIA